MKRWIKASLLPMAALLLSSGAMAAPAPTASDNEQQQIAQVLDLLGVRALLEQTPTVLAAAIEAQTQFSPAIAQSAQARPASVPSWRRDLDAQLKPQALLQEVTRRLHEHYRADVFRTAQQRLQEPLAKRARYFELAMTQPGAEKNLRTFLTQNGLAQNGLAQNDQSAPAASGSAGDAADARHAVLREIEAASAASLTMATLQSAVAARVRRAAENNAIDTALLNDEIAERQRYLAPLAVNYLLYAYRYLRDDELRDYRDLLRDEAVQTALELSRQALLSALVGDLTPSTTPPPSRPR